MPESLISTEPARANPFKSWFMGGFEGSSFQFRDLRRVDPIVETHHDIHCEADYRMLAELGVHTVRDALRWHMVEQEPGFYDWSSFVSMLEAAERAKVQVVWDLCHFGLPDHVDLFAAEFPERFADFAECAARVHATISDAPPAWCPINEISYWSHAAGAEGYMHPARPGLAPFIKRQLVTAFIAAAERLRSVDARAVIIGTDPLIHVSERDGPTVASEDECGYALEVFDMLTGLKSPELGGNAHCLDFVGLNFYPLNQWYQSSRQPIGLGMPGYRALHLLLQDVWHRYQLPIVITESGAEGPCGPGWLKYVAGETATAERAGVPVHGLCIYPVMDYPAWLDSRHCRTGLITRDNVQRATCPEMLRALREVQRDRRGATHRPPRYFTLRSHGV